MQLLPPETTGQAWVIGFPASLWDLNSWFYYISPSLLLYDGLSQTLLHNAALRLLTEQFSRFYHPFIGFLHVSKLILFPFKCLYCFAPIIGTQVSRSVSVGCPQIQEEAERGLGFLSCTTSTSTSVRLTHFLFLKPKSCNSIFVSTLIDRNTLPTLTLQPNLNP